MRILALLTSFVVIFFISPFMAFADDVFIDADPIEIVLPPEDASVAAADADESDIESAFGSDDDEYAAPIGAELDALISLLQSFLTPSEPEPEELPLIHEHMLDAFFEPAVGEMSLMSIPTQPNYPYTGGAFMALNTNYGSGLMVAPEPFKKDTFAFVKGTDRIVNLTNATINCYWIMGGVTYSGRFQRYGEAEYAYVSGSTTTWRVLTVSALTDSNIQFLDETGERGIQRPYLTLETKILLTFIVLEVFIHALAFFRRR